MRLTAYSDYSLRVLVFLAIKKGEKATIQEIAESYDISKNHLMKVVNRLSQLGYVNSTRGRSGGLLLAKDPNDIVIGEVVRDTEDDFKIVECFDPETNQCSLSPSCKLKQVLNESLFAFLNVMDRYTLQDISSPPKKLRKLLSLGN